MSHMGHGKYVVPGNCLIAYSINDVKIQKQNLTHPHQPNTSLRLVSGGILCIYTVIKTRN